MRPKHGVSASKKCWASSMHIPRQVPGLAPAELAFSPTPLPPHPNPGVPPTPKCALWWPPAVKLPGSLSTQADPDGSCMSHLMSQSIDATMLVTSSVCPTTGVSSMLLKDSSNDDALAMVEITGLPSFPVVIAMTPHAPSPMSPLLVMTTFWLLSTSTCLDAGIVGTTLPSELEATLARYVGKPDPADAVAVVLSSPECMEKVRWLSDMLCPNKCAISISCTRVRSNSGKSNARNALATAIT